MYLGRPCQRCIKRNIGHLCHDVHKKSNKPPLLATKSSSSNTIPDTTGSKSLYHSLFSFFAYNLVVKGFAPPFFDTSQFTFASEFMDNEMSMIR